MKKSLLIFLIFILSSSPNFCQFTLTPKSLPETRAFLLTDFSYRYRINNVDRFPWDDRRRHFLDSEIGFMVNMNPSWALGANLDLEMDVEDDFRLYGKIRLRRWFTNYRSIDIAPGYDWDNQHWILSVDYNFNKWFAVTSKVEIVQGFGQTYVPFQIGIKMRSIAGLIGNGGALATFIYWMAKWEAD